MYPRRESHHSLCQNRTFEFFQRALCQENWLAGCSVGVNFAEDIDIRDIRIVCMESLLQQELLRRDTNGKSWSNSENRDYFMESALVRDFHTSC